jgi:hypothetical protein
MNTLTAPLPGRLRLWFSQLKQQAEPLARLAAAMRAVDGVLIVETSPITGGLLIHYDALIGKTTAFWDQIEAVLFSHDLFMDPRSLERRGDAATPPAPPQADNPGVEPGRKIGGGIACALVGKLFERSAVALVAALL